MEYIDRQAANNALRECVRVYPFSFYNGIEVARSAIIKLPAADVAPVLKSHWYWDEDGMDWGIGAWRCDNCKSKAETWWASDKKYNPLRCSGGKFCGNCGADMREVT